MAGELNFQVNFNTQEAGAQIVDLLNKFINGSQAAGDKLNRALSGTTERKLVIRTERDDKGIKQLTTEVVTLRSEADKLANAFKQAQKTQPGSITGLQKQLAEAVQARNSIRQYSSEIDLLNRKQLFSAKQSQAFIDADEKVKTLQKSLRNLQQADAGPGGRFTESFNQFLSAGRNIQDIVAIFQSVSIAVAAVVAPIREATNALSDLQSFGLTFKSVGQSSVQSTIALTEASRVALGLGVNVRTTREAFQQLTPVILNTGGNIGDVSAITEALSSRFVAFGASADKQRRILNGWIQALGKGRLTSEEFTQQISEAEPAIKGDFAKALNSVKTEFEGLAEFDGKISSLEELIKSGNITVDVLKRVIPLLSKAKDIFGVLGGSASSAADALTDGGATINQVRGQFDTLSQLNLEKFSRAIDPVVKILFQAEGAIIDFTTRILNLESSQNLASIFTKIASSLKGLLTVVLTGIEVVAKILSPFVALANVLLQIPGAIEILGAVLLAKLIKPIREGAATVGGLTKALREIADKANTANSIDTSGTDKAIKANKVLLASAKALRAEQEKKTVSGSAEATNKLIDTQGKVEQGVEKNTKAEKKQINKINDELASLGRRRADYKSQLVNISAAAELQKERNQLRQNIQTWGNLKEEVEGATRALRNQLAQRGISFDAPIASGLNVRTSNDPQAAQLRQLTSTRNDLFDAIEDGRRRLNENRSKLIALAQNAPEIRLGSDFKFEKGVLEGAIDETEREIKTLYNKLSSITEKETTIKPRIDPAEIDRSGAALKQFKENAINSYAAAIGASDKYTQKLQEEKNRLQGLVDATKQRVSKRSTPGLMIDAELAATELPALEKSLDEVNTKIKDISSINKQAAKSYLDVDNAVSKLATGTKSGLKRGIEDLTKGLQINNIALDEAKNKFASLGNQKQALSALAKLQSETLRLTPSGPSFDEQYAKLDETKAGLRAINQEAVTTRAAIASLETTNKIFEETIGLAEKETRGFRGIKASALDLAGSSNGVAASIGKLAIGVGSFTGKTYAVIKNIGASIAAIGSQLAITAAISLALASYSRATETSKKAQDQFNASIEQFKAISASIRAEMSSNTSSKDILAGLDTGKDIDGVQGSMIALGNVIKSVTDAINGMINAIAGLTLDPLTNQFKKTGDVGKGLVNALLLVGAGALAGGLKFGVAGAAVGALGGALLALTIPAAQVKARFDEIKAQFAGVTQGLRNQSAQVKETVKDILAYANSILTAQQQVAEGKITPEQRDRLKTTGYGTVIDSITQLNTKLQETQRTATATREALQELKDKNVTLKTEQQKVNKQPNTEETRKRSIELGSEIKINEDAAAELTAQIGILDAQEKLLAETLAELRVKFPTITNEMIKNSESAANLSEAAKKAQIALDSIDPKLSPNEFKAAAEELAALKLKGELVANTYKEIEDAMRASFGMNTQEVATENRDTESARIDAEKQAIEEKKRASAKYYSDEIAYAQQATDNVLQGIEQRKKASDAYYNNQIKRLKELTPSEKLLADKEKAKLQKQANRSGAKGIEAKAKLERMAADEEIDKIEEKKQAASAAFDEEKTGAQQQGKKRVEDLKNEKEAADAVYDNMLKDLDNAREKMQEIFEREYNVKVNVYTANTGARASGGPVSGGTLYKVNELGREGFMNRFGNIKPINKARNSKWRAPSDGTVIPAHIFEKINDKQVSAPSTAISHSKPNVSSNSNSNLGMISAINAMGSYMSAQSSAINSSNAQTARIQSSQALEIAKLSRAINALANKNWNVGVNVRNTGNMAYLDAISRGF